MHVTEREEEQGNSTARRPLADSAMLALAAAAVAIACAALWTRSPQVGYLIGAIAATGLTLVLCLRRLRAAPIGILVAVMALLCWSALAVIGQRELARTRTTGEEAVLAQAEVDARRIAAAIDVARGRLREALDAIDWDAAQVARAPEIAGVETALAITSGREILSSRGTWRVEPLPRAGAAADSVTLVETPLYRVLIHSRMRGARSAHAAVLLQALPPADGIARGLVADIVGEAGARRIVVGTDATLASFAGGDAASARSGREVLVAARLPTLAAADLYTIERARTRTLPLLAIALLALCFVASQRPRASAARVAGAVLAAAVIGIVPLSALSNRSALMDAAVFFVRGGGPWTANLAALLLTGVLAVMVTMHLDRARRPVSIALALVTTVSCAIGGPVVIRELAHGINPPAEGISTSLWVAWQNALALVGVAIVLLAITAAAVCRRGRSGPVQPWMATGLAVALAAAAPYLWRTPAGLPLWYGALWSLVVLVLAISSRRRSLVHATIIAGAAASTAVWSATARRAVEQAERDVARLRTIDEDAARLLERFGWQLLQQRLPGDASGLLAAFGASDLAAAGLQASMHAWRPDGGMMPVAEIHTSMLEPPHGTMGALADRARAERVPLLVSVALPQATVLALAVADSTGDAVTVTVSPRTATFDGGVSGLPGARPVAADARAPYTLALTSVAASPGVLLDQPQWTRDGSRVVGDWLTQQGNSVSQVHAEVELRSIDALLSRGILLIAINVAVVTVLWLAAVGGDGGLLRWLRRRWMRVVQSYRARLTLVLSLFFALPAALFALWTFTRVRADDQQSRAVLAREALRTVPENGALPPDGMSRFLFRERRLTAASDAVLFAAAPFGLVLDDDVVRALIAQRRPQAELTRIVPDAEGNSIVQAYRSLAPAASVVAMAPAVRDDGAFATRRADLLALVFAASLIGVLGASWLGGRVARQLERPVNKLRQAVLALPATGGSPGVVPAEFIPVFEAVQRTGRALTESRDLLEAARARTEAVLRNVASAVVAFDERGGVLLANPRAERLPLRGDATRPELTDWPPVVRERVEAALARPHLALVDTEPFGFDLGDRQWQGRLTRLDAGGVVVTLDDVTELARAERVIAWGEMARQVAHEIKNPLTPVRLGIQHLRRAWRDGRGDFGPLLETNVERILNEIDHLDQIARQFSRFGAPPSVPAGTVDTTSLSGVDPVTIAHHVVHLESLGGRGVEWRVDAAADVPLIRARGGELHEVLLNLCENARLAEASTVVLRVQRDPLGAQVLIEVADDGVGIAPEHLSRIFEPQFSTRTSGTGLGLAICRRIVTGWGGTIEVESAVGAGTIMRLRVAVADALATPM